MVIFWWRSDAIAAMMPDIDRAGAGPTLAYSDCLPSTANLTYGVATLMSSRAALA
jgi:hypothetical protein